MNTLEKSILATIVYYDVLEKPLTSWEIFKFLINLKHITQEKTEVVALEQVLKILDQSKDLSEFISQKNGFYFLKSKEYLIKKRINKQKLADKKWKKAKKYINFLKLTPFIRSVIVSGSLAINNTKKNSDIDLLIISTSDRIWTCRVFTVIISHLLGKKRNKNITKDRLCLNHYLTDNSLKVKYQSLYNAQTYAHLTTIWEKDKNYKKKKKNNNWIKNFLVFYPNIKKGYLLSLKSKNFLDYTRKTEEWFLKGKAGNLLELFFKKIQEKRIKKDPLTYAPNGRVVYNNQQLEFHPNSPEKRIIEKYNSKMSELGFKELSTEKDSGLIS